MYRALVDKAGRTLIETVIALGIFLIIAVTGTATLLYANQTYGRMSVKSELLENARIALDFMTNQMYYCDSYYIKTNGGVMDKIIVRYRETENPSSKRLSHEFNYNPQNGVVRFGNQRLAGFIKEVRLEKSYDCLIVHVTTYDKISDTGITCEPLTLTGTVSLKNKTEEAFINF